jgi:hypothetical protein
LAHDRADNTGRGQQRYLKDGKANRRERAPNEQPEPAEGVEEGSAPAVGD